ncbi:MAG: CHC2 zinc finger domain-containing protein [Rhodopila sp.]|nr:CHC2 zinc finger domain-containing protein [Rhodopila sp.]
MTGGPHILAEAARRVKASVSIAAVVGDSLSLKRNGQYLTALCPFHDERTPSLNVYEDHYHCFGCGAHGDVITWVMATRRLTFAEAVQHLAGGAWPDRTRDPPLLAPKAMQAARSATADVFLRCWNQGVDPAGTIVQTYLRTRGGLTVPDGAPIRFHPRCQRGARNLPGGPEYWPAMLALMTDPITGQPVGLHRTYLRPDGSGKAPMTTRGETVLKPKMIMGTWGVVRLAPIGRALAITEGIENALTAMQVIGWGPTWAVGTQDGIKKLPVLPWIEAVTIFADADDSGVGLTAARTCAERWDAAGREAVIHVPPEGEDWNDAAQRLPNDPN